MGSPFDSSSCTMWVRAGCERRLSGVTAQSLIIQTSGTLLHGEFFRSLPTYYSAAGNSGTCSNDDEDQRRARCWGTKCSASPLHESVHNTHIACSFQFEVMPEDVIRAYGELHASSFLSSSKMRARAGNSAKPAHQRKLVWVTGVCDMYLEHLTLCMDCEEDKMGKDSLEIQCAPYVLNFEDCLQNAASIYAHLSGEVPQVKVCKLGRKCLCVCVRDHHWYHIMFTISLQPHADTYARADTLTHTQRTTMFVHTYIHT